LNAGKQGLCRSRLVMTSLLAQGRPTRFTKAIVHTRTTGVQEYRTLPTLMMSAELADIVRTQGTHLFALSIAGSLVTAIVVVRVSLVLW
jgi:hypothetical protein